MRSSNPSPLETWPPLPWQTRDSSCSLAYVSEAWQNLHPRLLINTGTCRDKFIFIPVSNMRTFPIQAQRLTSPI